MSEIQIRISHMDGRVPVTVLHVGGDIDANSHRDLDAKFEELTGSGAKHILLNLSDSGYMSNAGFRSMHKIHTALKGSGDDTSCLKLLNPSDKVKRLLKTMGFDIYFTVHDDMNEAVNDF